MGLMKTLTIAVLLGGLVGCAVPKKVSPVAIPKSVPIVIPAPKPVVDLKPIHISIKTARGIARLRKAYDKLLKEYKKLSWDCEIYKFKNPVMPDKQ